MEGGISEGKIKRFQDLFVYQNLYQAMVLVHRDLVKSLPAQERFDLVSQVRRASKAGPAILAEGWPKRYYRKVWRKYLLDVQGECSEMIHHLNVCSDIYPGSVPVDLINRLLKLYSISAKQISVLIKNC